MLLALAGITGVGKSFYSEEISKKLNFKKVNTIRTRKKRPGEKNGIFMTEEELEKIKKDGEIIYDFKVFGGTYAYKKCEILSKENYIFEMHYTTIYDWKKIRPDIVVIYILPTDIKSSIEKIKERKLPIDKEQERIQEIEEQYENFINNKELQKMFDYVIYNNYDEKSENDIIKLVEEIMHKNRLR